VVVFHAIAARVFLAFSGVPLKCRQVEAYVGIPPAAALTKIVIVIWILLDIAQRLRCGCLVSFEILLQGPAGAAVFKRDLLP
jgi:hypothetical protein